MVRLLAVLIAFSLALGPLPGAALDLSGYSKMQRLQMKRFAVNNSLFTLYHEVAHLLIDQLELPVLGREEDAADNVATWMMLQKNTPEAKRALEDAAQGWILTGESYGDRWTDQDFASGYSPDRQRAMQIICLIVGSDGAAFRAVANYYAIHPERQRSCHFDYELTDQSLRRVLSKSGTGSIVDVVYHDAAASLAPAITMLKDSGILETVAEEVRRGYRLDTRVTVSAVECGEPNAFYDPATIEIIFCYELMEDFLQLYVDDMAVAPPPKRKTKR